MECMITSAFRPTAVLITRMRFAGLLIAPVGSGVGGRGAPISPEPGFSQQDTC